MALKFLIINGPNLNMLGRRDSRHYGTLTLESLNELIKTYAEEKGCKAEFFQSSFEGAIIDKLHTADCDAVLLNAGAYTHYSYAIRDAIECIKVPVAEVHLSDTSKREPFRHVSVIRDVCKFTIQGLKQDSYLRAIDKFLQLLEAKV